MRKMKAVYHTLNQFSGGNSPVGPGSGTSMPGSKALIGECWCPVKHLDRIHLALRRGTVSSASFKYSGFICLVLYCELCYIV